MIGLSELIIIAIIAIAVLKPEKLGEYTNTIKSVLRSAQDIKEEAEDIVQFSDVTSDVTDMANSVKDIAVQQPTTKE